MNNAGPDDAEMVQCHKVGFLNVLLATCVGSRVVPAMFLIKILTF